MRFGWFCRRFLARMVLGREEMKSATSWARKRLSRPILIARSSWAKTYRSTVAVEHRKSAATSAVVITSGIGMIFSSTVSFAPGPCKANYPSNHGAGRLSLILISAAHSLPSTPEKRHFLPIPPQHLRKQNLSRLLSPVPRISPHTLLPRSPGLGSHPQLARAHAQPFPFFANTFQILVYSHAFRSNISNRSPRPTIFPSPHAIMPTVHRIQFSPNAFDRSTTLTFSFLANSSIPENFFLTSSRTFLSTHTTTCLRTSAKRRQCSAL